MHTQQKLPSISISRKDLDMYDALKDDEEITLGGVTYKKRDVRVWTTEPCEHDAALIAAGKRGQ
jgi:hypothetical protein